MRNQIASTLLLVATACGGDNNLPESPDSSPPDVPPTVDACDTAPSALRTDLPWFGDNLPTLTGWLDSRGCKSTGYDKEHRPIALFDWDNTISKNDFGDALTYYFVSHGLVLQPPSQDWKQTNPYLTATAVTALTAACGTTVQAGQRLPTDTLAGAPCADEILSIYDNETTRAGAPAFIAANARRYEPAFAWTPQLMAGYTHAEIQQDTTAAITAMLAAPVDATQTIGTTVENGWLRIYDQQKDLIHAAQTRGYDIWIITASPQDVIGTAAQMVGVPFDHVIGIRSMTDANGKLLYTFEGCGPYPDGQTELIPFIQGKRCFVNKVAFGDTTVDAIERRPDGERQVFAAGDSDSDVEFLRDADFKLAINRNKSDVMCHAYNNERDSWRINPMFIEPKLAKTSPYPCATTGATDEAGLKVASRDEAGNIIADQADSAHP